MEDDLFDSSQDRINRLGFKPQKEVVYNSLLHYADELDEEAKLWLVEIKTNLSKSVILREIRPGCVLWSARLAKYIKIHGLKFSKEDHVAFIHLIYELLTIPKLETYFIDKFAQILYVLIKKRYLLTPDDLVLEWRPLYDLCKRILTSNQTQLGLYRNYSSLNHTLCVVVQSARFYFPETATQEILDEIKPQLSPLATLPVTAGFLEWFLPVSLPPEKAHLGYKLWFDDIMELWTKGNNSATWDAEIMSQMASLASHNIGYIDWEPYIPSMFTRFLHSFNLPVVYKQQQSPKLFKVDTSAMALWIVSVLGGGSSCQMYLDKFLKTIESYFHPANFGVWFFKLKEMLRKLPEAFVERLHQERYKPKSWLTRTPESHRLTEEDIDRFVDSMKGIAKQAVYSKLGCTDVSVALQNLAVLRPKMIIPVLIESLYSTLDSVTEPHKLTSVMQCIVAVARPMVEGAKKGYPEGPTHVIPMLMLTLPGIDANDFRKCVVTFQFISIFVSLVPIIDSSKASEYYNNLTEEEEVICAATANFEDFVAQFFGRIFNFIDSSTLETTRMEKDMEKRSKIETLAESALSAVCYSVLSQCSTDIFKIALKKLHTFVTERILETKVAGRYLASICRKFSRVNPEETLKCLVPHLCNTIMSLTESPDIQNEEILDKELLYNMLILSELLGTKRGTLPFVPSILAVLDRTLHLSCREGYKIASKILNHLLVSLTSTCPTEQRAVSRSYDLHVKDYLSVKDWGKYANYRRLNLEWHVPGPEEIAAVQEIVSKYLPVELERIEKHISDEKPLSRSELCCSLKVILGILGGQQVFPLWEEDPICLLDSALKTTTCYPLALGVKGEVHMPDGSNIRKAVVHAMDRLQEKMLTCNEDDTKSLFAIIQILEVLLLNKSHCGLDFEKLCKNFQMVKKVLEDPLLGKKNHVRVLMIDRVVLQHEGRRVKAIPSFTNTHKLMLLNLLRLSCSFYSQVRVTAQAVLFQGLKYHAHSYTILIPQILENLQQDSALFHERFKGSLYVLLGPKMAPFITMHNWDVFTKLWPALIKATPSSKFSIITLLDSIIKAVQKHLTTIILEHEVPDACVEKAKMLWKNAPLPEGPMVTDEEVERGIQRLKDRNEYDLQQYYLSLNAIMDAIEENNLHWRYYEMGIRFLRDLVHPDVKYPARAVKIFLHTLINDSLELRKIAVRSTIYLLKQQKRPYKKVKANIQSLCHEPLPEYLPPGIRPDNMWLQYNSKTSPKTEEDWDQPRYLHKPNIGYFHWPKDLELFAPSREQPPFNIAEGDMTAEEREVQNFFLNKENIDQLITYFSLEDRKGKDKFNGAGFFMFKQLFKNHGDAFLDVFKPHLQRLVVDKHESSQRCAAEIIAGLIRGSKHWPFDKVTALWEFLGPLIRTALSNMTEETVPDWGICFATAAEKRDPNRIHWLLEILMEDPLREESSYLGCGRLYALQGALNQQKWRVSELHIRLLDYVRPFLTHPFQNVRERIGNVLTNIFQPDMKMMNAKTLGPHVDEFMLDIVREVDSLYSLTFSDDNNKCKKDLNNITVNEITGKLDNVQITDADKAISNKLDTSAEKEVCIRLFKTICKWITSSLSRSPASVRPEYYSIFPLLCILESYDQDDEIGNICTGTVAALARSPTEAELLPLVFSSVWKVARSGSWWAKSSVVEFLQVFIFHNMFTVLNDSKWTKETTDIVLEMLQDERLEVREKAAEVLGGLLHCDFISNTAQLLEYFKKKADTKIKNSRAKDGKSLRIRHSGILGLCSFINSSPYDVPDCVPEIFFILGNHLNDPQPIPSTIRKTLNDFKRTHHDNWEVHQLKFTEKELEVMNDLTVPPSYYA
ncbi:UNVERIFIED_CONTAM: hypothetical protein PYX00_007188 [Menopon gallinae]|uniref:Proteasome activator complex subunit 4 n=1 Tax=Menopon gallinae TaxID=328185 RepID=A0AAW2HHU6_9NEOP